MITSRKKAQWVYYSLVNSKDTEFINDLIIKTLKNSEPYDTDLLNLTEWLKKKNIDC